MRGSVASLVPRTRGDCSRGGGGHKGGRRRGEKPNTRARGRRCAKLPAERGAYARQEARGCTTAHVKRAGSPPCPPACACARGAAWRGAGGAGPFFCPVQKDSEMRARAWRMGAASARYAARDAARSGMRCPWGRRGVLARGLPPQGGRTPTDLRRLTFIISSFANLREKEAPPRGRPRARRATARDAGRPAGT